MTASTPLAPAASSAPATPALPGAALAGRSLVLKTVPVGDVWKRLYETRYPDPLGTGPGLSRFSDPTGLAIELIYLGSSAKVCFVETILRDRADGRGADCIIDQAEIDSRTLASIRLKEPLRLVDLTSDGPLRMGVPSDVAGARDQTEARAFSAAFYVHPDQPDGVYYPSRLNEERCIALYRRAAGKLEGIATPRLVDCRTELASILDDLDISLV